MKKSLIIMLIATLLVGALMVSCNSDISEATSGGDKLVEIKIAGNSKGINAVGSMEDAESYFWYYRAGKNDSSVYRTGQTVALTNGEFADASSGWKPVRSDNAAGLNESVLGYFSTGDWLFAFAAYKTALTVTEGFATIPNESPVYSQASLNVEVSSNTIGADSRVHITVTPTAGGADADALVVFPTDGLKWQYSNSATDANYAATVSGLSGKTAYMNVYYIAAGSTEEVPLARASATISNDSTNPSATFTAFKGYDSTSTAADKFTLNQVTIPASYVGTEYTLVFKVALSTAEGELIGEESTQSVKAYTNGRITISTSGTVAVEDNESQYIVVVDKVSAIQTASENDGKTVTTSAQIAAPAVSTAEVSSTNTSVSTKNSKVEITSTNVSTSEKSAEKTSSVIIPAEGLKDTVKTLTATSTAGEGDNAVTTKTVTVEETSYNIVDKKDTSNTEVPSTFTGFTVNEGDAVISKLSYTMVATTTTTTTTTEAQGTAEPTVVSETTTTDSYSVTNFASENSSEVTYYIIKDYLDTDLVNVTVGYNGSGAQPIFSTTGTPDLSQVTNDESTTGTGYDPETGLIVFKTSHFSDFYVVASNTFVAENTTTGKKYYSLERAIARVENGETIKLLASVNLGSNRITLSGDKSIIFDLGTYTLTCGTNTHGFDINGAELTVKNGNIDGNGKQVFNVYGSATDTNGKYSVLTINDDVQITNAGCAICVFGTTASANNGYDTEVNLNGSITGECGIFVSGNIANADSEASNAMILSNVINLESGSSINTSDQAVAMNGGATVNVKEGSSLTGSEAIGLKRGTLNVTGGTLRATGEYAEPTANTNGTEASGAVVSITSTYNYARGIVAEISGGSFESTHGHALSIQKTNSDFSPDALSVSVSNGYFRAGDNDSAKAVYAAEGTTSAFLKGGYYSAAPAAGLVSQGYEVVADTTETGYTHKVQEIVPVAQVGELLFASLAEAVEYANDQETEQTIIMLASTNEGNTIGVNKSMTLDLNGKTISKDGSCEELFQILGWEEGGITFTIKDSSDSAAGKIICDGDNGHVAEILTSNCSVVLESGTLETMHAETIEVFSLGIFIKADNSGVEYDSTGPRGCSIIMNGGTVIGHDRGLHGGTVSNLSGDSRNKIVINGGLLNVLDGYSSLYIGKGCDCVINDIAVVSYSGERFIRITEGGTLTVNGGSLSAPNAYWYFNTDSTASVTLNGGTFDKNVKSFASNNTTISIGENCQVYVSSAEPNTYKVSTSQPEGYVLVE